MDSIDFRQGSLFGVGDWCWPTPSSRDYSELSDPLLFAQVLDLARRDGTISLSELLTETDVLRKTLRRLWVVDKPTPTTIKGLLSAMKKFEWVEADESKSGHYRLTREGWQMCDLSKNEKGFRRRLAEKMYGIYVVPGWLIARLANLNPSGQGEIVLPSPGKDWKPDLLPWEESGWSDGLVKEVMGSTELARAVFPGCLPIDDRLWIDTVRSKWDQMSARGRRKVSIPSSKGVDQEEKQRVQRYSPRERLTHAMRDSAVELMFAAYAPVFTTQLADLEVCDFRSEKHPLPPRAFTGWCPRLDALELVFYTDSHPLISGRLIFPCAAFRRRAPTPPFERIDGIRDPEGRTLFLHQPTWDSIGDEFTRVLFETYRKISQRVGAMYVSLLDVRDEVCRQLRLSSILFDSLLETAYMEMVRESVTKRRNVTFSLESDIRPEEQTAYRLVRRPVYVNGVPHTLIAVGHVPRV